MGISIQEMENGEQKIEYEVPEFISDKTENVGDKEEDFEVLQVIGAGAFSEVLKVRSKINFGFYAMKKIDINKADDLVGLENEGKFLQKLNHPNIVKIYKVFKDKSERYLYFIMELLDNGDLLQFKDALISSEKHAPEPLLWKIFYSCLLGLGYIHNEEIIHRDIKPNNLFIDENLDIKIGDFNISVCNSIEAAKKFSGSDDKEKYSLMENQYEKAGTEEYSAPEVISNEQGYDSKIDVYSMGTTFFEICYFKNHRFVEKKYEDYLDTDLYSRELNELIEKMIVVEPDNRISSTEAKKIAKKNYILKYVKNSSTGAVFRCFYSYKNFKYYFTEIINKNNDSVFNLPGKEVGKRVYQLFGALKENNIDNINDILYELRLELVKIGLKEQREDVEIDPGNLIFYILSRLNSELNELPSDKPIKRTNVENKKKKKKNIKEKKEQLKEGSRIIVSGLTKIYEENTEPILNDISFKLYQDEIFALLGQNGEGKSTFVSILTGLKQATSGIIIYQKDKESPKLEILTNKGIKSIRKKMGICNQNNIILYEDLTVSENLEIFSEFKTEEKIDIGPIISELIQDFNLQEKANYKVSKLSGGEKRKLVIASAFCGESEIIILDEPTGGIDLITKNEIWEALKKRKQNKIILLITHYMDEAWELADRCGILKNGKIIFNNDKDMLTKTYGKYINIQINKKIDKK